LYKFPLIELVDRYTIAQVKHQRTNGANQEELDFYTAQLTEFNFEKISVWLTALADLHNSIWDLEDDFKKCKLDNVDLAEIGRRALQIRDFNNLRIQIKNHMAELLDDPVREIKNG
jgi:hypothetical protein